MQLNKENINTPYWLESEEMLHLLHEMKQDINADEYYAQEEIFISSFDIVLPRLVNILKGKENENFDPKNPFIAICNTDRYGKSGHHWFTIAISNEDF